MLGHWHGVVPGGCRNFISGHLEKQVGRASPERPMHFSSCLWAQQGTAQPLPVPSSCIFRSFYPLVFLSRAPAARRPDPGGQWRFPNWGYKREVPHPNGNFPFLLLLCDSVKWLWLWVAWRTPGHHSMCCSQEPTWKLSDRKIQYKNRAVSPNCVCEILRHSPPPKRWVLNSSWHPHSICCSFPARPAVPSTGD